MVASFAWLPPAGLDPHFFVKQGLTDQELERSMLSTEEGGPAILGYEFAQLRKFNQGGPWDAQREPFPAWHGDG